jgi:hypothetical protein
MAPFGLVAFLLLRAGATLGRAEATPTGALRSGE